MIGVPNNSISLSANPLLIIQRVCTKCSKPIAGKFNSCSVCLKSFHPGCVKAYSGTRTASACCIAQLNMSVTPRDGRVIPLGFEFLLHLALLMLRPQV